jgi:hypothetical protein
VGWPVGWPAEYTQPDKMGAAAPPLRRCASARPAGAVNTRSSSFIYDLCYLFIITYLSVGSDTTPGNRGAIEDKGGGGRAVTPPPPPGRPATIGSAACDIVRHVLGSGRCRDGFGYLIQRKKGWAGVFADAPLRVLIGL